MIDKLNTAAVRAISRREMLRRTGTGFGLLGLAGVLAEGGFLAPQSVAAQRSSPLAARPPHFTPRAKRVIFLFMNGGPSHVDTFDPKPILTKYAGQYPAAAKIKRGRPDRGGILPSPFTFRNYGQSGIEVSELYPHLSKRVDDLCVIRSMYTDNPNHEPSLLMMNSGNMQPLRPSLGSWLTYGLGSENQNLPGFVVLCPGKPVVGPQLWGNSFLPGIYQGTHINNKSLDPKNVIQHLHHQHLSGSAQRRQLDLLREMNLRHLDQREQDAELEARIGSLEVAYRMQFAGQEAFDISRETAATAQAYGKGEFADACLIARRLVERGVRVVQIYYGNGQPWDAHNDIMDHKRDADKSDQPIAALLADLKERGLLEETLVIWGGEFGRTPTSEKTKGRDHHALGFTMWLAGGGVRGGMIHGATDEFGMQAVESRMHVHDLHATILHLMGLDHERLTYRYSGRDFRLTDVAGNVAHEMFA